MIIGGCLSKSAPETNIIQTVTSTPVPDQANPITVQDKETIQNLETRIMVLETQVSEMDAVLKYNGMMEQSSKNIIPIPPFEILIHFKKNMSYLFRPDGVVEMTYQDPIPTKASYELYHNNNTIKIYPKYGTAGMTFTDNEYDYYWLRLFDNYAVSTYENGWVEWVAKYDILTNTTSKWEEIK